MHFDIQFREDLLRQIQGVVGDIKDWNADDSALSQDLKHLGGRIVPFDHCATPDHPFRIAGSDGSGDFPCVRYGDSFVYLVTAMARLYEATPDLNHLRELKAPNCDIVDLLWLPEDKKVSNDRFRAFFEHICGVSLPDICTHSDYYNLCKKLGNAPATATGLIDTLIFPEAHEDNNVRIQMMGAAEAAVLIKLLQPGVLSQEASDASYVLQDTTLALPLAGYPKSLFFEIAKRFACRLAREKSVIYLAVSKSHNLPHIDSIEELVRNVTPTLEHWFLRLPTPAIGEQTPHFIGTRAIPPVGAVTYLFRLHRTMPTMRLDMDFEYWKSSIWNRDERTMREREMRIFRDLDFASHDQRCYGYPYPIKACHDMASLTEAERVAFRKKVIDEAVANGLKRKNFLDPSIPAGHK